MSEAKRDGAIKRQLIEIANASGESWSGFGFLCLLFSLITLIGVAIASDHKVRCYYLQTTMTEAGLAYKIKSDINWQFDEAAFSSNDENKTLEVIQTLKQCAPAD